MVMMHFDHTSSIKALAAVSHDHVDVIAFHQLFQLGVDGRKSDLAPILQDQRVQVLGTDETLDPTQNTNDFASLSGIAGRTHDPILPVAVCFPE
jgi:hypothetical protein